MCSDSLFTDYSCHFIVEEKVVPEITPKVEEKVYAVKTETLKDSLIDHKDDFFTAGEQYGIDPILMLAIAQHESVFGKKIPYGSYNPFGRVCDRRYYDCAIAKDATSGRMTYWNSYSGWEDAIFDESRYLKERYYDNGLNTPCLIGKKYAEDSLWCQKIIAIMEKFKKELSD